MPTSRASEHADVVVVGSGFGGSVAAYRMAAEAGPWWCWSAVGPTRRESFARTPEEMGRNFWDPSEGLPRALRRLDLQWLRGRRLQRTGRRVTDLRQRHAAQGREVVRPRVAAARRRLRVLADHPRPTSTRTTTTSSRCWARRRIPTPTTPKTSAMREAAGRARPTSAAAAGGQLRATSRRTAGRPRRAAGAGVRQRAWPPAADLPPVRRVRPRLQRRREEHPRPHLPLGGQAPRRGPAHPARGQGLPAARRAAATR